MSATFKFQTASPDPEAAINTGPSATLQISIIGVHYMLIGNTFYPQFFALNKMSSGDTGRATLLITQRREHTERLILEKMNELTIKSLVNDQVLQPECI